ncbi:DHA2 family efflux MFS transporter permease subunit [Desulfosporosinus sp. Sb-LF]|uniref:DHA2 family efflux MFS transporter permease subunit n=1 Tax=Desulfosporosinus sp. Sb-LF TaxID=2560027 RepID=UPI00107F7A85|nr:DHA2 family efflux MFS transporter permease subunit [Desulfosporosinus sp. Sb-LF]TGE34486.1 DHA2 family efflux MFS transporter permease subunit [Desulfosporosinus sp. Sb-LF]
MDQENSEPIVKWLGLFVVIIGTFMAVLDSSVLNIAIPKLMAVFAVNVDSIKWVLTAYTLALGAIIPLSGYLSETFGNKKVYIVSLAIFTIGSGLCGVAWSNSSMIVFRIIQAMGGGMLQPVGMSIIYGLFPLKERGLAMGFYGIAAMAAPAIGPTLGGYVIQNLDWRLIFFIKIPIGIIGIFLATIFLTDSPRKPAKSFDYVGLISSTVAIVSILYVLGQGTNIDWNDISYPLLISLGCCSFVLFIIYELMHPDPLVDLRVFKYYDFSISQIVSSILTFALMGGSYIMPLFLQNISGYSAMQTGIILFPAAIATGVMMPISGVLFDKLGAKPVVIPGLMILAFASYKLAFVNVDMSKETITLLLAIRGIGLGIAIMPIATVGLNAIPLQKIAKASAISNTLKQISGSLSITIITNILQSQLTLNYNHMSNQITVFNNTAVVYINKIQSLYVQRGLSQSAAKAAALSTLAGIIQKQAYTNAIDYAIFITSAITALALGLTFIMSSKKKVSLPMSSDKLGS